MDVATTRARIQKNVIAGMVVLRVLHPCELDNNCSCELTKLHVARWIEPRARWGLFYSKMQSLPAPPSPEGGVKPFTPPLVAT